MNRASNKTYISKKQIELYQSEKSKRQAMTEKVGYAPTPIGVASAEEAKLGQDSIMQQISGGQQVKP